MLQVVKRLRAYQILLAGFQGLDKAGKDARFKRLPAFLNVLIDHIVEKLDHLTFIGEAERVEVQRKLAVPPAQLKAAPSEDKTPSCRR